jgi:hypothetical protein
MMSSEFPSRLRSAFRALLIVIALSAAPVFLDAQTSSGFAGGVSLVGPDGYYPGYGDRFPENYSPGFSLTAFVGRPVSPRLSLRFDGSISRPSLREPSNFVGILCAQNPPPGTCCGICPLESTQARVDVASLTANVLLALTPVNRGGHLYVIGGAGPYYVSQPAAIAFGVGAGAGWSLPLGRRARGFLEARYQRLLASPQLSWMAPVTVGVQF